MSNSKLKQPEKICLQSISNMLNLKFAKFYENSNPPDKHDHFQAIKFAISVILFSDYYRFTKYNS